MSVSYPKVKAVMWFDEIKTEAQAAGALIDWRYSNNQQILAGLSSYIQQPAKSTGKKYWMQLSDFTSSSKLQLRIFFLWCVYRTWTVDSLYVDDHNGIILCLQSESHNHTAASHHQSFCQ